MSPEERAQALSDDLLDRGKVPILTHEARAIIASAIRAAENDAYERAAERSERFMPSGAVVEGHGFLIGPNTPRAISFQIRSLKHQEP